jgi:tritrans,polycis-undecaprenyl-diphosphate synthase [geranylgeranyl-diphosphate specific]
LLERLKQLTIGYIISYVYKFYTIRLEKSVANGAKPKHIGIILDGNRRWARWRGYPPTYGHKMGYNKAKEVLDWCWELKIPTVTVYALSLDNIRRRSKEEVENLISLVDMAVTELMNDRRIMERGVKVKVIGRRSVLPKELLQKVEKLEQTTANNKNFNLFLAVGYSGRAEIIDAIKKITEEVQAGKIEIAQIDETLFSKYLYTAGVEDPDLILRTGGESRLSDFLPWQAIYSEFVFIDVPWPEFRKIDFLRAIRTYQLKERRFGS